MDTSNRATGAILYQDNAMDKWTITYSSQKLAKPETRYSTVDISNDLVKCVKGSRSRYQEYLDELKKKTTANAAAQLKRKTVEGIFNYREFYECNHFTLKKISQYLNSYILSHDLPENK
uniref:Reverse transcriptase RNase H-like domain-containing protein n=1 Tax=Romanomermis culicivorax TaxID=13658 RepID=A0A915JL64_ROMCU